MKFLETTKKSQPMQKVTTKKPQRIQEKCQEESCTVDLSFLTKLSNLANLVYRWRQLKSSGENSKNIVKQNTQTSQKDFILVTHAVQISRL